MRACLLIIAGFAGVHLFKMIRLYLVLMEHKLPLWKFVLLYLRTTLVNLVIPFKLGEVYRIEEIARLTGIWQVGILSVVVDRFFDILALFLWLLPMELIASGTGVSAITLVFALMIALGTLAYLAFPGSFSYLNRFLIMRKASSRSMAALKGLDLAKGWYDFTARLVRGRAFLITLTSALGWGAEILTLKVLAQYLGVSYGLADFPAYISSLFVTGAGSVIRSGYTGLTVVVILAATVAGYLLVLVRKITADR